MSILITFVSAIGLIVLIAAADREYNTITSYQGVTSDNLDIAA